MLTRGGLTVSADAAGNTLDDGVRTSEWDAAGRLATIAYNNHPELKSEFRYDGLGRRVLDLETSP